MQTPTRQVEDSVAKVDGELAVGEDLNFQRRWWAFEKWIWRFFAVVILADVLGVFGRGPLANAQKTTPDGALTIHYERIERFSTPSIFRVTLGPSAVRDGAVYLWASTSLVSRLGNQRIIPEPASSKIVQGGVIYTFLSGMRPGLIAFALQPAALGVSHLTIRLLPGDEPGRPAQDSLTAGVMVMP